MLSREDHELLAQTSAGTPMGELLRRFWVPVMLSEELPEPQGLPVRVRVLGEKLIAFRTEEGRVGLLGEHCHHRGASLYWGRSEHGGLRCAYHGWRYDLEGRCVEMPNLAANEAVMQRIRHTAYPCVERAGCVWAWMGPPELRGELPALEYMELPESHVYVMKRLQECHWTQGLDGDIDTSHVAFLHESLAANRPYRKTSAPLIQGRATSYGLLLGARRETDAGPAYWRVNQWLMPWFTNLPALPDDAPLTGHAWVPYDDERCWSFAFTWHPRRALTEAERADMLVKKDGMYTELQPGTYIPSRGAGTDYAPRENLSRPARDRMERMVHFQDQDRAITESMGPLYDRTKEHLMASDTIIVQFRNRLIAEARALAQGRAPSIKPSDYRVHQVSLMLPPELENWWEATEEHVRDLGGARAAAVS